jgi:hypothetical protein
MQSAQKYILGVPHSYSEIHSNEIADVESGFSKAYMYPWNTQGTAVTGAPGMIVKSGNVNGTAFAVSSSGELYFGQKQDASSAWKWFKVAGSAI